MPDLGKAYVQIVPSAEGMAGMIQKAMNGEADKAGDTSGKSFATKFASVAKKVFVAAGVGKFITDSLSAGADLQQSFGGIDTLYGDAANQAKQFAQEAAAAGISANTYAEQAVSFGAALKQSFGGNTLAAAEAANTAIMDMADNSAKFGTDIESIQMAYQGFAKQNYTMLDNLKLGYGGTKTEMERLLKKAQELTGVEYNIDNLGDVYEAIHVIQDDLGVAGVAAEEAKTTFTGSMQAMKASAENLMANLALGEDISQPLQMLTESISAFLFNNFLPMVGNILAQVPQLIVGAISNVGQFADELVFSGVDLVTQLVTGIITSIPQIVTAAGQLASNLWNAITSIDWLGVGTEIMNSFNGGVALDIPQIVATGSRMIASFIANIASHLPEFLQKGIEIIGQLVAGLIGAIPDIVGAIPGIVSAAAEGFTGFDWGSIGMQIINGVVSGIRAMGGAIADALMGLAKSAWDGLKDFFGIASPSKLMRDTIGQYIPLGLAEGIDANADYVSDAMESMAKEASNYPVEQAMNFNAGYRPVFDSSSTTNYGGVNINITATDYVNAKEIAKEVSNIIMSDIKKKGAVFA